MVLGLTGWSPLTTRSRRHRCRYGSLPSEHFEAQEHKERPTGRPTDGSTDTVHVVCSHRTRPTTSPFSSMALLVSSGWKKEEMILLKMNKKPLSNKWSAFGRSSSNEACLIAYLTMFQVKVGLCWTENCIKSWKCICPLPPPPPHPFLYRATGFWSKEGGSWMMTSPSMPISTWRMASLSESSSVLLSAFIHCCNPFAFICCASLMSNSIFLIWMQILGEIHF